MSFPLNRVLAVFGSSFLILTPDGERTLSAAGRLPLSPVAGDFVTIENGLVTALAPRRSEIARRAPGSEHRLQVMAANIDILFIVSGLDGDFNIRRLERYLVLAIESRARPAFVLTKADLCADVEAKAALVQAIAPGAPVILSGLHHEEGIHAIRGLISEEITGAFIGSSGAGKSTLLNRLLGFERQAVSEVRASDSRGRHTTTHRQLFRIPGYGWILDQPGLREIQIVAAERDVDAAFADIQSLAAACRFRDCRHAGEPGCAVAGQVDAARLRSFTKLRREADRTDEEADIGARIRRKQWVKGVHRAMRKGNPLKG